jgi:hypothetical protein
LPASYRNDLTGREPGGTCGIRERASLMESLTQGTIEVPLGVRGRLVEPEGSHGPGVFVLCDLVFVMSVYAYPLSASMRWPSRP